MPERLGRWRQTTVAGGLLAGLAIGLKDVFEEPDDDEAALVEEIPLDGEPHALDVALHPDEPTLSIATIRPWLR